MDKRMALFAMAGGPDQTLADINRCLANAGVPIKHEDALMLAERRIESLADIEWVEFGTPAVVTIAKAIESSPCLTLRNPAATLAYLQDAFYNLRDELPIDVPDAEIVEALRACLDELGNAAEVAAMPADELMAYSQEYVRMLSEEHESEYRITDDEGNVYTFDPVMWDYDETAPGWNGERWADDWDD